MEPDMSMRPMGQNLVEKREWWRIALVIGVWVLLIAGVQIAAWREMISPIELAQRLMQMVHLHPLAPLMFVTIAALSSLLFIPAALLGGLAGTCFGPLFGVMLTLVGCNLSALLTYGLGRLSTQGSLRIRQLVEKHGAIVQRNPFLGVIVLRLSFLPYDPINYLIGCMRVHWLTFLVANTIGSLPGVIVIVLMGSSFDEFGQGLTVSSPLVLVGGALVLISVVVAVILRRRHRRT